MGTVKTSSKPGYGLRKLTLPAHRKSIGPNMFHLDAIRPGLFLSEMIYVIFHELQIFTRHLLNLYLPDAQGMHQLV